MSGNATRAPAVPNRQANTKPARSIADPAVECRHLWKLFGGQAKDLNEILRAIDPGGLSKDDVRDRFGCVIGVADVSFQVSREEVFCIMGLSGSGKSTLLRHINRLIEPSKGHVLINGDNVNSMSVADLRRLRAEKIGMVFQNMALFPHRTIIDNVTYGLEVRGVLKPERYETAREKLSLVQLSGWEDRYPRELSGGMQQRVGLARALACDPDILLMDEPFSALDPLIRRELQDQFLQLSKVMKKTTILITHDLEEAIRLGDRIAIMRDGQFVQVGTPQEIILNPADKYVANFTEGVFTLRFLPARLLVEPIDPHGQDTSLDTDACPRVPHDADFIQVVKAFLERKGPVVVLDEQGAKLGLITTERILKNLLPRGSA